MKTIGGQFALDIGLKIKAKTSKDYTGSIVSQQSCTETVLQEYISQIYPICVEYSVP